MIADFKIPEEIKQLRKNILHKYINVRVYLGKDHLILSPDQEVYCLGWTVKATTLDQADHGIAKNTDMWKFWNELGLKAFHHRKIKNPGSGNIQLHPTPNADTIRVGLSFWERNQRYWIVLEKQNNTWVDVGTVDSIDQI